MPDTEAIASLEEAGFASWPAETEWRDDGFVIRLSPALPYKRCSSVNFTLQSTSDPVAALSRARSAFNKAKVGFCIRQTPLMPAALGSLMDAEGWPSHGHSHVMTVALPCQGQPDPGPVISAYEPDSLWLDAYGAYARALQHRSAFAGVLKRIVPAAVYLSIVDGSRIVAVGITVIDGDLAGLFGIAVDSARKREGLGERLSRHALQIAAQRGARIGWLQVEAANAPAIALYSKIGFTTAYSYCYRVPPANNDRP